MYIYTYMYIFIYIYGHVYLSGMASCLQLDLPWFSLQKHLVQVDTEGNVNYKHFLERCRPQVCKRVRE